MTWGQNIEKLLYPKHHDTKKQPKKLKKKKGKKNKKQNKTKQKKRTETNDI